ncbi:MAG: PDZ domain-containing protein, partial [Roseomonas sp.]|nr:PDZ domain-containing protein [Roseomonas sp.]
AFGDSDQSEVGDWVIAIGNPFGFGGTVTAGIVSARGRDIGQGLYDDFIQTDASINQGNSGGPLFNMRGQVIGINTAIVSPSGVSAGLGFAIPSNMATRVVAQLRDAGRVRRGWIGVNIQGVTDDIAEALRLPAGTRGALVANAQAEGPAAQAGIRSGDVIIRFNGVPVPEMRALPRIVADNTVGSSVPVVIWRDGKEETVTVTLGELPAEQRQASAPAAPPPGQGPVELTGLGLRVAAITNELRQRFNLRPEQRGVVIVEVIPGTPAAERELRPGDVIVEVQQQRVSTPAEVQEQVERLRRQNRNVGLFAVENAGGQRFVPLRLNARGNAPG